MNAKKWTESEGSGYRKINNAGGPQLGYSAASGVKILTVEGYTTKFNKGVLP
jgi:hypothetical protein